MINTFKNVTVSEQEVLIKKKHRILFFVATLIIFFYLFIPLILTALMKEIPDNFLFFAWVYVILLFIMTWGIGVWHYSFIKKYELIIEESVRQTDSGEGI
ncbi:hypothetical protein JCM21714_1390 [Gracilibacillus boraciitolerans JCM 21714]|uniref:DUF485 domain-containing protein n=1 Tax=Gracilibacillus boraciitolerans JCM 21714 TaxID=1298598 RepID=W4VGV1_9BACI|nr:hypothetical protein [Gracilibacillus boraciitolerans]GAE92396.1 hypothetical protein JCM21714_1390 [Gracilibacillus boraciitolerans JCM 21714]